MLRCPTKHAETIFKSLEQTERSPCRVQERPLKARGALPRAHTREGPTAEKPPTDLGAVLHVHPESQGLTDQANSVLVSWSCSNKVAQSSGLSHRNGLTTPECKKSKGGGRMKVLEGLVPSGGSEGESGPCLPASFWRLPGSLRRSLFTRRSSSVCIQVQISPFYKTHPTCSRTSS